MTDLQETLQDAPGEVPAAAPPRPVEAGAQLRCAGHAVRLENPLLLIGAGVLAIAGIVAFTNRKKIAAKAGPMIEDAKAKAAPMIEDAKVKGQAIMDGATAKGQELLQTAKTQGKAIAEKLTSGRTDTPAQRHTSRPTCTDRPAYGGA
jgi:hypothetical protein